VQARQLEQVQEFFQRQARELFLLLQLKAEDFNLMEKWLLVLEFIKLEILLFTFT
jgi:hypothetical protein